MSSSLDLSTVPFWVLAVFGVVGVAQLAFELWVLVKMLRTPSEQLTLGGRKWVWALLILLVNWIGAIIFLAAGRKPAPVADTTPMRGANDRANDAADLLYGSKGPDHR